jgi:hypothetical protein
MEPPLIGSIRDRRSNPNSKEAKVTERTTETEVIFQHPFHVQALTWALPPGTYRLVVRENLIEGLSFLAYEKTYCGLEIPAIEIRTGMRQHLKVNPGEIEAAQERDRSDHISPQADVN